MDWSRNREGACGAAKYESMSADEVEARLRSAGIDPARTIAAVAKLVQSKLHETGEIWSDREELNPGHLSPHESRVAT